MPKRKSVSGRIRKLRGKESQKAFAQKYGYSQGQIGHIESGRAYPSVKLLLALNAEYGVSIDYILKGKYSEGMIEKTKKRTLKKIDKKFEALYREFSGFLKDC